jgi:hypothetical protein
MSRPEVSQPETHDEKPSELTQREFLKKLVGSAAGLTGLAMAANLSTATSAEAAYVNGGATSAFPPFQPFPAPVTTGDQVNTNLQVTGHLAVKGYRPWVDVTAFGALGDGSSCGPAVLAAINSLPASGGLVYFPPGTYVFDEPIG